MREDIEDVVEREVGDIPADQRPEELVICEYERAVPDPKKLADGVLFGLFEELDERYGDPESYDSGPDGNICARLYAAESFVKTVLKDYVPWLCEPTGKRQTVKVKDYLGPAG